jgi:hypothetical protein
MCLPPLPEDGNKPSFRNAVFSSTYNSSRCTKSRNPVILSVIHHRQNPSDSNGNAYLGSTKGEEFFRQMDDCQLLREGSTKGPKQRT